MWGEAVPILCYHRVGNGARAAASEFTVTASALNRQIVLLRRLGYRSYTVHELVRAYERRESVHRGIVLSFDDGYRDTFATAAPILHAHGFKGTVFAVTQFVGRSMQPGDGRTFATWDELRWLRDRGWEVGLHTATHADLGTADADTLRREVIEASWVLQQQLGEPVWSVAYPWGRYSPGAVSAAAACGARAAVTVARSLATPRSPRYALPRYAVRRDDTLLDFLPAIMTGCGPRSIVRFLRRYGRSPVRNDPDEQSREEWWRA